jgi:hypothetical protein
LLRPFFWGTCLCRVFGPIPFHIVGPVADPNKNGIQRVQNHDIIPVQILQIFTLKTKLIHDANLLPKFGNFLNAQFARHIGALEQLWYIFHRLLLAVPVGEPLGYVFGFGALQHPDDLRVL